MNKLLAEVTFAPGYTGFYALRVLRYPNGRKRPEPLLLGDATGQPFASRLTALDACRALTAAPALRTFRPLIAPPTQPVVVPAPKVKRKAKQPAPDNLSAPTTTTTRTVVAPKPVQPVVKLMPPAPTQVIRDKGADYRFQLNVLIESGAVRVRRYGTPERRDHLPKRGGVMPAHLNPVTID